MILLTSYYFTLNIQVRPYVLVRVTICHSMLWRSYLFSIVNLSRWNKETNKKLHSTRTMTSGIYHIRL